MSGQLAKCGKPWGDYATCSLPADHEQHNKGCNATDEAGNECVMWMPDEKLAMFRAGPRDYFVRGREGDGVHKATRALAMRAWLTWGAVQP